MIKMAGFFKNKKSITVIIAALCIIILGGLFFQDKDHDKNTNQLFVYNANSLFKYKSHYIGDASNVSNLLTELPLSDYKRGLSLATENKPYGLSVNYDLSNADMDMQQVESVLRNNALIMFALIENVDKIAFNTTNATKQQYDYQYSRAEAQKNFNNDLWGYSKDIKLFEAFLNNINFKLFVFPNKYTPSMSSTPGIRISAEYHNPVGNVRYSVKHGVLLTWSNRTAEVLKGIKTIEVPYGSPVYWSPINENGQINEGQSDLVTVTIFDPKGDKIDEKQLTILYSSGFYIVEPSPGIVIGVQTQSQIQKPKTIEDAVSSAIKEKGKVYLTGEHITEGHIILDTEERDDTVKVYTIASVGWFGFENGIFTKVSGSGAIPIVMIFSQNDDDEYTLLKYMEPEDGARYADSIKKMFPGKLHNKVISAQKDYSNLVKQQEAQAMEYLTSIGRKAKVSATHVEKKLVNIDTEASNKLFAGLTKYNSFLNNCPYWIGTKERIENGVRYIYETSQSKTSDGYDLVTFKKLKEDGTIVEESKYKIIGNEPQLID